MDALEVVIAGCLGASPLQIHTIRADAMLEQQITKVSPWMRRKGNDDDDDETSQPGGWLVPRAMGVAFDAGKREPGT